MRLRIGAFALAHKKENVMPIDLTLFDNAISSKDLDIQTAQAALDADTLQAQLTLTKAKADDLGKKQNEMASLKSKRNRAIELQSSIDTATAELTDIVNSLK